VVPGPRAGAGLGPAADGRPARGALLDLGRRPEFDLVRAQAWSAGRRRRARPGSATQREIGAELYLSINTVKAYNKSLYRKLGVASRPDAVAVARQLGLI
jgi:hypothetical protein